MCQTVLSRVCRLGRAFGDVGASVATLAADLLPPVIDGLLAGEDATVIAYGQSSSGKSHAMGLLPAGVAADDIADAGTSQTAVLPSAARQIFKQIEELQHGDSDVQVCTCHKSPKQLGR